MRRLLAPLLLLVPTAAQAEEFRLSLPLDCALNETCFIQNYVDSDPGPGASDFTCAGLTYDTHKGTDFALMNREAMEAGVTVRAAAPGVVTALRDEMPDTGKTPDLPSNRFCGNGVLIDHGDGWETQYCHMKRGSIVVAVGDEVTPDSALGEVGLSGSTEFPHIHIAVRKDGQVIDPFNTDARRTCGADDGPEDDLWAEVTPYRGGGILSVGVADAVPEFARVKDGTAGLGALPASAPALVGFAQLFGGRADDLVQITLTQPDGAVFYEGEARLAKPQARLFRAMGKKRPAGGWQAGEWTLTAVLTRGGTELERMEMGFSVGH